MATANVLVLDALSQWAQEQPNQKVWTFLDDKGEISDSFTYKELDKASTSLANYLVQSCKLRSGDRALLVFFPGLHFTASLLACFKAGIIAIPVFPPDPRRLQKDLTHFISIQSSSGATVALTHNMYNFAKKVSDIQGLFSSKGKTWPELKWIVVDDVLARGKAKANDPSSSSSVMLPPKHADTAFLQYTSGSTSEPKGVMITHANLAHNLTLIIKELKATRTTVNVSWLPQYHDMGLIGSYLGTLYCGGVGFFLSPISFLKDPNVWLKSVSKYKGTHTQAPNFAYALASRKFRDAVAGGTFGAPLPQFSLRTIQHMINAAEPVDQSAIANFYDTFRPYGLPSGVVVPTYGLAEHTVFVCSGGQHVLSLRKNSFENQVVEVVGSTVLGDPTALATTSASGKDALQTIVGCGYPERGEGVMLCIVDADSRRRLADGTIGEIWVTSASKAMGYWNLPELSAQDFHAICVDVPGVAFLRTGDLGFLHQGELFICGRSKDLIIVRGSNHYPQDIERTAERSQGALLRPGCSAAFAVNHEKGHTERVVYVAEVMENVQNNAGKLAEIIRSCRAAVSAEHGVMLSSVVLLRTRTVPKTTSGKIARAWCRKAFLENTLTALTRWDGGDAEEDTSGVGMDATTDVGQSKTAGNGVGAGTRSGDVNLYTVTDEPSAAGGAGPGAGAGAGVGPGKGLSVEEVRALPVNELVQRLETTLKQIASQGPAPIQGPVDPRVSLLSLGLDSFTIVQFKGVIEKRFHTDIPDEFLFIQAVNLNEIARAVKNGSLTADQQRLVETAGQGASAAGGALPAAGGSTTVMANQKQPMCPWCICCY